MKVLILVLTAAVALSAQSGDPGVTLERAIRKETVEGDLKGAIDLYKKVVAGAAKNRAAAAKALLRLGECYEKQGDAEAKRTYERLVREFSDQTEEVREARARLAAGGGKSLVAQLIAKGPGLGSYGRVTGDGRLVPFFDSETGDVALRDLRTGAVSRLTNGGTRAWSDEVRGWNTPIPSRDGKRIAYVWNLTDTQMELRIINVDGSGMHTVPYSMHNSLTRIWDWSPDGKNVLAAGFGASWWGLAAINVESGEAHELERFTVHPVDGQASFDVAGYSQDGRWVVYSRPAAWGSLDWDIFAIDTRAGTETAVVAGAGADREPLWTPAGDAIVFRSNREGRNAIWMVRFRDGRAAGAPMLVKPDAGDYHAKGMSRDGSFFYTLSNASHDVYKATVDAQTLRVVGAPTPLVDTYLGHNWWPRWSPSGDSFAYFSLRDNQSRLVVHHAGGEDTVVADVIRWTAFLSWCGNGEGLTSLGTPSPARIRIFDARTGKASLPDAQVKGLREPFQLGFSPDCKSVYVSSFLRDTRQRRIYRYDISTARETDLLADGGEWALHPSVSPDGRWLALYGKLEGGKESGILLISTAGGPLRMLAAGEVFFHRWTPDSKRLMFIRSVKPPLDPFGEKNLYWVPVEGGEPQPMGIRMPGAAAPSLHPDGKRLLFSALKSNAEFWVLRNLPLN